MGNAFCADSSRDGLVNRQIFFTALGFTAVVIQGAPGANGAARAKAFARMIEEFCRETIPNAFGEERQAVSGDPDIDRKIEDFKSGLIERETAFLPEDRATLLQFYDRLQTRKAQNEQKAFYETAPEDLIANRVLTLIDEEILRDEQSPQTV